MADFLISMIVHPVMAVGVLRRWPLPIKDRTPKKIYDGGRHARALRAARSSLRSVEQFWLGKAKLPRRDGRSNATRIAEGL